MNGITLVILTPEGEKARLSCSHVTLFAKDNARGEGGGSFGIRRGHLPALAALKENSLVEAISDGGQVRFCVGGGFASIRDEVVTVVTENAE